MAYPFSINFKTTDDIITLILICDSICCILILILLRIFLYCKQTLLSCICLGILIFISFPLTILWLIVHWCLQRNVEVDARNYTLSRAIEETSESEDMTKILAFPILCLIGFVVLIAVSPDYYPIWITFLALNIGYYFITYLVIFWRDIEIKLYIICSPFIFIIMLFLTILLNIIGSIWICILFMKLYHAFILCLIGAQQIKEWRFMRKETKKKEMWKREYLKYNEYCNVFKSERKELLLQCLEDINVVNIILNFLDGMEIKSGKEVLYLNISGDYLNDCGVINNIYDIDMEFVRTHIKLYFCSNSTDYTLLSSNTLYDM